MAEGEATSLPTTSLLPADGPPIVMAKGSAVSFFKGGLTAVRINEDSLDDEVAAPDGSNVLSPTKVPIAEKFKSDAGKI